MVSLFRWMIGCWTLALSIVVFASPSQEDFVECHELVSQELLECLNDSPGKLDLICLDQSRIMLKACYKHVHQISSESSRPLPKVVDEQTTEPAKLIGGQ